MELLRFHSEWDTDLGRGTGRAEAQREESSVCSCDKSSAVICTGQMCLGAEPMFERQELDFPLQNLEILPNPHAKATAK